MFMIGESLLYVYKEKLIKFNKKLILLNVSINVIERIMVIYLLNILLRKIGRVCMKIFRL